MAPRTQSSVATRLAQTPPTEEKFYELYEKLNLQQRQAVDTIEGVVMVLAGPGTGKTQVLAMRIAKILLETQMDPHNILCLTFTESGVAAMRSRLISIIGTAAYYVRIHTFHSFCNEIIQEYPEKFTFARELEVLSDLERVELFHEILDELPGFSPLKPFGNPYLFVKDVAGNVASLKAEHITSDQYAARLTAIEKLVKKIKPSLQRLITAGASRTPAQVEAFAASLQKLRARFPDSAIHFDRLQALSEHYQAALAAAIDARGVSRAITKYRNDIKRWFESTTNRLPKQWEMKNVYDAYQRKLRARGRYDYEDMILFVIEAFKHNDELLAQYQEQFQYILVDEYQDTNGAQNEAVHLLSRWHANPNVFVVGDDKQSIYRFQGASLENLLFLYEQYRQFATVIVLQQNYRSQQTILDAGQAVIAHNRHSIDRYIPNVTQTLTGTGKRVSSPVMVKYFDTADTEVYGVAREIAGLLSAGVPAREIAVLYRRNADADDFVEVMLKLNLPVQLENGHNILDDIVIQQLLVLLRYLNNPAHSRTLWHMLQYAFWRLPALDIVKVQLYARKHELDLFTVISQPAHVHEAGVEQAEPFWEVARKIAEWQVVLGNRPLQDFVATIVNESGLLRYAMSDVANHLDVLNCLRTFFNEIKQQNRRQPTLTLSQFLRHLDLLREHGIVMPAAALQTKRNAVRLMTAHKSKGLEFEHVFIVRANDRHWGNLREHGMVPLPQGLLRYDKVVGEENNEDERRLFYVAMTRAKQGLHISYAEHSLAGRQQVPAIFVAEIPDTDKIVAEDQEAEDEARTRLAALTVAVPAPARGERLRAYLATHLERYVLSATHLNNYVHCPRLFYYRNLLQVPSVKTTKMAFGTAIHAALYDLYAQLATKAALPTRATLLDSFAYHLRREILTETEYKDALELGQVVLAAYYDHYRGGFPSGSLLEYSFDSHGVTVAGIPITGAVDKIEIDRDRNVAHVVDYKTGNPDTKRAEVKAGGAYWRQLVFYKILCDGSPRFRYAVRSGEIDFVQKSPSKNDFVKKKITISNDDTTAVTALIQEVWQDIQHLKFLDPDFEKYCGICEYCQLHEQGQLG